MYGGRLRPVYRPGGRLDGRAVTVIGARLGQAARGDVRSGRDG
jgi:hypothetical protein